MSCFGELHHWCAPMQCLCKATSTRSIHCAKGTATEVTHPSQSCSCTVCPRVAPPGLSRSAGCCQQTRSSSSLPRHGTVATSGEAPVHTSCNTRLVRSVPLATHKNCEIDIRSAANFLPASAMRALSSSGHHCLERTC